MSGFFSMSYSKGDLSLWYVSEGLISRGFDREHIPQFHTSSI